MMVYVVIKVGLILMIEGIRMDVMYIFINVSCIYSGFICSEINEKVEKVFFIVDIDVGCCVLVKVINKEKVNVYVFSWFWVLFYWVMWIVLVSSIRKMS